MPTVTDPKKDVATITAAGARAARTVGFLSRIIVVGSNDLASNCQHPPWPRGHLKTHSIQRPYPDIAKTDGLRMIAVRLQLDRRVGVRLVFGLADVEGLAGKLRVVLH